MTMLVGSTAARPSGAERAPALRNGDRFTRVEFHRRYEAMPSGLKAELIEGIVQTSPPVGPGHGDSQGALAGLFALYQAETPGVRMSDNATLILGPSSELQPDLHMRLLPEHGGQVKLDDSGLLSGPPELVLEVADSSETTDLVVKRREYERAGVLEYLVLLVNSGALRAFDLPSGIERQPGSDGVYRSNVFPGLWINTPAVIANNMREAVRTIKKGVKSPEHAAFVGKLKSPVSKSRRGKRR